MPTASFSGSEYLPQFNLLTVTRKLISEYEHLREQLEETKHQPKQETSVELGDRARETDDLFVTTNNRDRLQSTLTQVEKAINKTKSGSYGVCENCNQTIELARLRIVPEAEVCSSCAKQNM